MLRTLAAMLRAPREVVAGRPCVTSMHSNFIPDASEGAGSEAPACFGLSGIKNLPGAELAQQEGWNVRSANDIYLQEWEDPSWKNGPARKSCPHTSTPESLVIRGF